MPMVVPYVFVLLGLFMAAVPVAFALAGTSIVITLLERGLSFNPAFMVQKAVSGIDNFMLLSVPFFIYAGKVMNVGGITVRIYAFAKSLVGAMSGACRPRLLLAFQAGRLLRARLAPATGRRARLPQPDPRR